MASYFWLGDWTSNDPGNLSAIMSNNQALNEYLLNKLCPYLILGFLLLYNFKITDISLYSIIGLVLFIDWYSGRVGRAIGEYDNNPQFRKIVDESLEKDSQ